MHKHPAVTEKRIEQTIDRRILPLIYTRLAPLQLEAFVVSGEPIAFEQASVAEYQPFEIGQKWGGRWDTVWFRVSGRVPEAGKGREIVALLDLGFGPHTEGFTVEGLVWRDGAPVSAVNVHRQDCVLLKSATGGEEIAFYVEAAANPVVPMHDAAEILQPEYGGPGIGCVRRAELAIFHPDAKDLYFDMKAAFTALQALPEDGPRRGELLGALNRAVNLFDDRDPHSSIGAMREALRDVLASKNGGSAHRISAVGHAHIDTAWLWPLRETIRKCARTFSTALLYMEAYPDYKFACSQAQQYAWMKEYYPDIYEGIKKAIQRGQWEPIGSMWIEADCNLSSGESLIRQLLHGKNFFLEEFGYETRDVWIPDVFGYCAALPQIMKKVGVDYFLTQKISWSQFNKFPHHTFLWEGIDGTRIFTHFPPADTYNASMLGDNLAYSVKNFKESDRASRSLYLYGFGDGGGGPTKQMLELAARFKDFDGMPKVELERAIDFFPKAEADASDLPVWSGELYLELHRGTYTTQAANKLGNRKSEFLLREAEYFDAICRALELPCDPPAAELPAHAVYDVIDRPNGRLPGSGDSRSAALDRAWKLVLLNQFHDIIPGSSIKWVYEDSARDYATVAELARRVLEPCVRAVVSRIDTSGFAQPAVVFNTLGHARSEAVTLPDGSAGFVTVPAYGHAVVYVAGAKLPGNVAPVAVEPAGGQVIFDNGILRVVFDPQGEISSIRDHRCEREVLAAPGNRFQLHQDYPNLWDAWDVDIFYKETVQDCTSGLELMEVVESSPERATLRIVRRIGQGSRIEQQVRLSAGSARLDFETRVDWHEDHRFLKVAFPVLVRSPRATYEIQYGHVERPTHSNTSWDMARFEVCAQKWADLSEGDYGVALLNDCKYGYDIEGSVMRLSLLRAPSAPDPTADRGEHHFTYALLPHAGDFRSGEVVEQAYALNVPLRIVRPETATGSTLAASGQFFSVNRANVIIEAVKKAERENAVIVRLYETHGSRGPVIIGNTLGLREACTADLLENSLAPLPVSASGEIHLDIAPFEIVTLKFPLGL